ncbi:MAG TPA: hypothetical protein PLF63_09445 [Rubrivivax sp.]|jgi:hypothetical protein|nr:hypothetical protein [Rubrivivax sp.]
MSKKLMLAALAITSAALAQAATPEATLPSEVWLLDSSGAAFCDGFTNIVKSGPAYSGLYDASSYCSIGIAGAGGPAARGMKPGGLLTQGAAMAIESVPLFGISIVVAINTNGTWGAYDLNGNYYANGLWTTTPPTPSSNARVTPALSPRR